MSNAFNLSQLANFCNSSGQVNAVTGLYNTGSLGGFASGTRMSFQQTSAPTGWTKDTTAAINDSMLRLVTGSVTTGGTTGFSTWSAVTATGATTLDVSQIPSHNHSGGFGGGNILAADYGGSGAGASTGFTGGGGSHTHSLTRNLKYFDFIIASKD
jgi:hypothetical protein